MKQARELFLGPRNFGMISAAMPEIIIQKIFSGIGSVIFTEINYPKHFFRSVYFLWAMVVASWCMLDSLRFSSSI